MADATLSKSTYSELLKHPLWQRKRLEILDERGFECEYCGDKEKTLHIHHSYYERGLKPWDYPNESLHVLCENCHEIAQESLTILHRLIGRMSLSEIDELLGFAIGKYAKKNPGELVEIYNSDVLDGVAEVFATNTGLVLSTVADGDNTTTGARIQEAYDKAQRYFKVVRIDQCSCGA